MKLLKKIKVPTGEIYTAEGELGTLEFLTVGDYGKHANIKADFLGITRELNGVPNGEVQPLTEKWVVTISTQYGCSMGCRFCDVPKVGPGRNATRHDMLEQVWVALNQHPDIKGTKRLNIHFARMGEPTWNSAVLTAAVDMKTMVRRHFGHSVLIHPVVSTMMPAANQNGQNLEAFLCDWCRIIKNEIYDGDAGLQISVNSTDDEQRKYLFGGNSLTLGQIAAIADRLPKPKGRKYTLNFALADDSIIEGKVLASLFDPERWICKITPLHRTSSAEENGIRTTGGYEAFTPYKAVEDDLKAHGFDVIVFVPSYDEDDGLITCGNAILSGKLPSTKYEVTEY